MRTPDRAPDGELLLGLSPRGTSYHAAIAGLAACFLSLPVTDVQPASQVPGPVRCQRRQCRQHWVREGRAPAAAGDVEHICPACFVERDKRTRSCPNCESTYRPVPEALAA